MHANVSRAFTATRTRKNLGLGGIGCPIGRRRGHALGRQHRRSRRCIKFCIVVKFNNLGGFEKWSRDFGEAHHEDCADGKVRSDHTIGFFEARSK